MFADGVDLAVDNDIVFKAVCFDLLSDFWPVSTIPPERIGLLGAAFYVLTTAIERADIQRDPEELLEALRTFVDSTTKLEPTETELVFAAELELAAQRERLEFDPGETQLVAMVIERSITMLETGDKRAIRAIERLLDQVPGLAALAERVRCLEQIVVRMLTGGTYERIRQAICDEAHVDKTLSICFGCASGRDLSGEAVLEGLKSYIGDLREDAPTVLCA